MIRGSGSKIHGEIKSRENGGGGDAGGNDSGRGDCGFNEYGSGRYAGMTETAATETCQRCRTTTAVKGVRL